MSNRGLANKEQRSRVFPLSLKLSIYLGHTYTCISHSHSIGPSKTLSLSLVLSPSHTLENMDAWGGREGVFVIERSPRDREGTIWVGDRGSACAIERCPEMRHSPRSIAYRFIEKSNITKFDHVRGEKQLHLEWQTDMCMCEPVRYKV